MGTPCQREGGGSYLAGVNTIVVLDGIAAAVLGLVVQPLSRVVHAVLAARSGRRSLQRYEKATFKGRRHKLKGAHPQLRHRLEQVKYSSGKKQLLAASSPVISPLKRSLSACKERELAREKVRGGGGTWGGVNRKIRLSVDLPEGLCR